MFLTRTFLALLLVRFISVFVVRTYYVPDEYWQSLEVAHKLSFGYGYLTWEWVQGIRSYVYPLIIAAVFKLLSFFNMDDVETLIIIPRILHAVLAAYADYRFVSWSIRPKWSLYLIMTSWFWFYSATRTLTNTVETAMTSIGLSLYAWNRKSDVKYLWPSMMCCFIRPTAAVLWVPFIIYHYYKSNLSQNILKKIITIGCIVCGFGVIIDSWMYGRFIVTPYEFLKFNIYHNIGRTYGSNKWYWYFIHGLPAILGILIIPFICGVLNTLCLKGNFKERKILLSGILFAMTLLSLVDHKEFRFISFLLPACLYITADTLGEYSETASRKTLWFIAVLLFIGNMIPAWYLSTVHQRGQLETMKVLRQSTEQYIKTHSQENPLQLPSILFLMPCHSTPFYSHMHQNITMRFLTCEPNLKGLSNYQDDADLFYKSPMRWLRANIPIHPHTAKPTHIVIFDVLAPNIEEFLEGYKFSYNITNSEIETNRVGRFIYIYERLPIDEDNLFNIMRRNNVHDDDIGYSDAISADKIVGKLPSIEDHIDEEDDMYTWNNIYT